MRIEPFGVEQWMNEYETRCSHNLAETCVESLTVGELLSLTGQDSAVFDQMSDIRLTYGAIEGSDRLRSAIADLYWSQTPANVLVTHGAIGANHLVHMTLVEPDDRVVAVVPTYQQHYSIPASIGADVRRLDLRPEDGWLPDSERLASLVGDGAKLVALTNPNNPTGSLIDEGLMDEIVEVCRRAGAWLLCDEVYRGIDQDEPGTTGSVADRYERGISTGSMSKAFSLAGLRLGWVVAPRALIENITIHRDYNTISVGMIDDLLASVALESAETLLARSREIVRGNQASLAQWVEAEPTISWHRPKGGTTALLAYEADLSSRSFCVDLVESTGVMLTPGSALGVEGYLRIGYANSPTVLSEGLDLFSAYLATI